MKACPATFHSEFGKLTDETQLCDILWSVCRRNSVSYAAQAGVNLDDSCENIF